MSRNANVPNEMCQNEMCQNLWHNVPKKFATPVAKLAQSPNFSQFGGHTLVFINFRTSLESKLFILS